MAFIDYLAQGAAVPKFLSPAELQQQQYKNELAKIDLQTAQQQAQGRNALRQIFSDPASLDPETGMPNRNAMTRVFAADPDAGVKLTGQINEMARQREAMEMNRIHGALYKLQINERQADDLNRIAVGSQEMYDQLVAQGVPQAEAVRQVSEARAQQLDDAARSGFYSPGQLDRLKGPFDPVRNRAFIAATPAYREYLAGQKQDQEPPKTRNRIEGDNEVQEQWDPKTRTWTKIGEGPRFAKTAGSTGGVADAVKDFDNYYAGLDKSAQDAIDIQSWNYINKGTLPYRKGQGGGADRNDLVVRNAARIAGQLGMSAEELASMPAVYKADAQSLSKATQKLDAVQATLESFHNNLETFDNIAKGVAPKLGGEKAKELGKELSKINFIGVQSLDDIKLRIQQQVNDPTANALLVAAMAAATDYGRIMQGPQSAAALTEGARKDAMRLINAAMDDKARTAVMGALDSDTAGQVKGLEDQREKILGRMRSHRGAGAAAAAVGSGAPPTTNAKGWKLMVDKNGNKAYVSPDGKNFEPVK